MEKIQLFWKKLKKWFYSLCGLDCSYAFSELKCQTWADEICFAVRQRSWTIPAFRDSHNGCIRISMIPLCTKAEMWLRGDVRHLDRLPDDKLKDACEREFVYKIDERGSHTIQWVDPEDGHTEPVNCYGYSALKTAWASWQMRHPGSCPPPQLAEQSFCEANGWSMHAGSVYMTILLLGEEFMRLYVCTSGAKSSEDEQCSMAGMLTAQELLFTQLGDMIDFIPDFDMM